MERKFLNLPDCKDSGLKLKKREGAEKKASKEVYGRRENPGEKARKENFKRMAEKSTR